MLSPREGIKYLSSIDKNKQYNKCKELLDFYLLFRERDVNFRNLRIEKATKNFVLIDAEPISCSLMLDLDKIQPKFKHLKNNSKKLINEESNEYKQYASTRSLISNYSLKKQIKLGLRQFYTDAYQHGIIKLSALVKDTLIRLFPEEYNENKFALINNKAKKIKMSQI